MTDEGFKSQYEWKSICKKGCYSPYEHTHELDCSQYNRKHCQHCNTEMTLDAQSYQSAFGKNVSILLNHYKCEKCGATDEAKIQLDSLIRL